MKNKFITLLTIMIMSVAFAITAFAAKNGWDQEANGNWKYYKDDCELSCEWHKDGGYWYYFGADGYMMVNSLVDNDDGSVSYVDEAGHRVASVWIQVTDESRDFEEDWIYIKSNGKSVIEGWYTVNGNKYCFAGNKMLTGFVANNSEVETYVDATNYCDPQTGARVSGWVETEDSDGNQVWCYFKNGVKAVDTFLTIGTQKYLFDSDGKMLTGIQATGSIYYNFDSNGHMTKKAWVEKTNDSDGTTYWIYATANGQLVEDGDYKVNGTYYYFADYVMVTGWAVNGKYYKDNGAMATGSITIENSYGESEQYYFLKDGTPAQDGYNGRAYDNGKLIQPKDDHKYLYYNGKLVKKSGTYCTKGTYKDSNYNEEWSVDENGNATRIK